MPTVTKTFVNTSGNTVTQQRVYYTLNAQGQLSTITTDLTPGDNSIADGNVYTRTYTYDGTSNRLTSMTETDGSRLDVSYTLGSDGVYRVTSYTQTLATGVTATTTLSYDLVNRITTVTDANGQSTQLWYDANSQLTKIVSPPAASGGAVQTRSFAYNANGDVTSVTDANNNTTAYQYDSNGNMTLSRDAAGNTVTRTGAGSRRR